MVKPGACVDDDTAVIEAWSSKLEQSNFVKEMARTDMHKLILNSIASQKRHSTMKPNKIRYT